MRQLYENQNIDYNDGNTEFVHEFNEQITPYGAIVYNHEFNSYQWIHEFEQIEFKNEIVPYYFKVKKSALPNGMEIVMTYEFEPSEEDDEDILQSWKEIQEIDLPVYDYDEEGELFEKEMLTYNTTPSRHTIWMLNKDGFDYLLTQDPLLFLPIIKYMEIVQTLVRNHTIAPFDENEHSL